MDNLVIDTPEQIPLEFPLAGIGSRFLALALDTLLQAAAGVILAVIAIAMGMRVHKMPSRGAWTFAVLVILWFLVQFGYFMLFEAIWNGQTPGKRLTHLRVIQDSGRPITVYEAAARNLLRIVDSIPGLYGVAIISALFSAKSKRLGDYVAGTVVVHERPAVLETGVQWDAAASAGGSRYDVSKITPEEFQLIEAFLFRRNQLAAEVRTETGRMIMTRLSARLEFTPEDARNPEVLLETLATAYRACARYGQPGLASR
ncbi:MAG: RDD family protein [Terriglobia bacterium]|jgi:uncharacterized RDD family membrane protein YckC